MEAKFNIGSQAKKGPLKISSHHESLLSSRPHMHRVILHMVEQKTTRKV